ncbi:hypothetical protein J6590_094358, partial [Homalodisca vitripennis]
GIDWPLNQTAPQMFPKLPKLKISHVLLQGVKKGSSSASQRAYIEAHPAGRPHEYGDHAPGSFCQMNQCCPVCKGGSQGHTGHAL